MATHEERIQALEDMVPGILRSQEMIVDALGAISEAVRGIARTQQEHTVILQAHSAVLQEHTTILQAHSVVLQDHTVLLRSIVSTVQGHSLELARIRGNMEGD